MERKIVKIVLLFTVVCLVSSCSIIHNLRTDICLYYTPRVDKDPYLRMKISRDMIEGIPSKILINNVKIPDSLLNNYHSLYLRINKHKDIYIIKYERDKVFNKKTHDYDYFLETIDTIKFVKKNKLEVNIELKGESNYFDIDLLKGRYIWFLHYWESPNKLIYNQRVGGIIESD